MSTNVPPTAAAADVLVAEVPGAVVGLGDGAGDGEAASVRVAVDAVPLEIGAWVPAVDEGRFPAAQAPPTNSSPPATKMAASAGRRLFRPP
jgi:hypothetical protein